MKYRKKPIIVDAITFDEFIQYGIDHGADIVDGLPLRFEYKGHMVTRGNEYCYVIPTMEGDHVFTSADMLITGVEGEIYPCKQFIFDQTYEKADEINDQDTVSVIRCGKCKWYDDVFYACSKCGACVDRSFFCADGERKE